MHILDIRRLACLDVDSELRVALFFYTSLFENRGAVWTNVISRSGYPASFFPSTGDSLERGLVLKDPNGEPYMVKAMFAGWLCDLEGHREITRWKGSSGKRCCPECDNLDKSHRGPQADDGTIGLGCSDRTKFNNSKASSSKQIFDTVDEIAIATRTLKKNCCF